MLTPTEIDNAKQRVNGATLQEIAKQEGVTESAISRRLSKPEVADYIDQIKQELIQKSLPKAVNNLNTMIENYKTETNNTRIEHGYRASTLLTEMVGLTPSRTGSTINIAGNAVISPVIQQIINQFSDSLRLPVGTSEVIDVEE
jgi:hypothetical protein